MHTYPDPASPPEYAEVLPQQQPAGNGFVSPSPHTRPRLAPYIAFFVILFASMAAAAAVANADAALVLFGIF